MSIFEGLNGIPVEQNKPTIFEGLNGIPVEQNATPPSSSPETQVQGENQSGGLGRSLGVFGRGLASGAAGLVDSAAALGNSAYTRESIENDEEHPLDPRTKETDKHSFGTKVNEWFGTNFEPKDAYEKFLHLAGTLSVPIGGGVLKQAASGLGSAAAIIGAEEAGIDNPIAQLGAGLVGGVGGLAAGNAIGSVAKKGLDLVEKGTAKVTGYSPKNIDLNAVEAAERLGVNLPNTAVSTSPGLIMGEELIKKTPIAGGLHNKKLQKIDDRLADKIKESFGQIGEKLSAETTKGEIANDIGKQAKEVLSDFSKTLKEESALLYQEAEKLIPQDATFIPNKTIEAINNLRDRVKKSFSPTTDEQYVLKTIDEIQNNLLIKSQFGDLKIPPKIENILATKRSLNDKINWDINASGTKNQLKKVRGAIEEDLADYGLKNPEWHKGQKFADNFYGKYFGDEGFKNNTLQKILKEDNPEKILGSLNSAADFKYIENVVSKTPEGKEFFNSLKREKFASLFEEKVLDKLAINSTDSKIKINYNPLSKLLDDPQKSTLVKYLVGGSNFSKVKDLVTYSKAMVGRSQRNPNPSGSGTTSTVFNLLTGSATTVTGYFGGLAAAAKTAGTAAILPTVLYQIVNSRKLLNYAVNTAKAAKEGNMVKANKWGSLLDENAKQVLGANVFKQLVRGNSEEDQDN